MVTSGADQGMSYILTRLMPLSTTALLLALIAGCGFTTPIAEIQAHPRDYVDKEVTVEGEVRDVFGLLVVKYFTLNDGSGEIGVVTERPLPRRGEHLRVTGQVRETFTLGDRSTLMLIERTTKEPAQAQGGGN